MTDNWEMDKNLYFKTWDEMYYATKALPGKDDEYLHKFSDRVVDLLRNDSQFREDYQLYTTARSLIQSGLTPSSVEPELKKKCDIIKQIDSAFLESSDTKTLAQQKMIHAKYSRRLVNNRMEENGINVTERKTKRVTIGKPNPQPKPEPKKPGIEILDPNVRKALDDKIYSI